MTPLMDRLGAAVEGRREQTLEFLRDLITAGEAGEAAVQHRVAEEARALGCGVETLRYRPGEVPMVQEFAAEGAIDLAERESVVARLPGAGGGRSLILFAHSDSEPVAQTQRWRHDPFAATIEDGRLYGWGVADDLAGVAALVQALHAVRASGLVPAGDVILASTPSKRHARGVSALLHGGLNADAAVYLHPAESGVGMREIKAFASGQLEFRVVIEGRPPDTTEPLQTAFAHLAVSAIDKALVVYRALQNLAERRAATVHHPALQAAVGRSTNVMLSYITSGEADRLSRLGEACTLGGAVSFPPTESMQEVQAQIEAAVASAGQDDAWLREHPPRLLWDAGVTGAEVPSANPLYRVVAEAVAGFTGEEPFVNPMHTSSDIRNPMVQKSIPTVGLGPLGGNLTQNGHTDEWVDVEDYLRSVKVAAGIIVGWCGTVERGSR